MVGFNCQSSGKANPRTWRITGRHARRFSAQPYFGIVCRDWLPRRVFVLSVVLECLPPSYPSAAIATGVRLACRRLPQCLFPRPRIVHFNPPRTLVFAARHDYPPASSPPVCRSTRTMCSSEESVCDSWWFPKKRSALIRHENSCDVAHGILRKMSGTKAVGTE
jgi:hypothetical protein